LARYLPWPLKRLVYAFYRFYFNMGECIFCRIVAGIAPADILHRDEQVTAFRDLHPIAPVHILIVPNRHIDSVNALEESDAQLVGHMFVAAREIAARQGLSASGYRLIINTGPDGGQTVFHMHLHLIGGRRMKFLSG
jgi:histidine triad (HIT) family protein